MRIKNEGNSLIFFYIMYISDLKQHLSLDKRRKYELTYKYNIIIPQDCSVNVDDAINIIKNIFSICSTLQLN